MSHSPTPNILLIPTDQQRKDSLGCYGNGICKTPTLDRLASNGKEGTKINQSCLKSIPQKGPVQ